MSDRLAALLDALYAAPDVLVYLALGIAAALENLVPPVPADVTILFGAFLAGQGAVDPLGVFLVVWLSNVAGALFVYALGWRYGVRFFRGRLGGWLLRPGQLQALTQLYQRRGIAVVFLSRFLPMFRAVVPVFAGVAHLRPGRTIAAIASASAVWYGTLVLLGSSAGANWEELLALLARAGRWLWAGAILLVLLFAWWWRRTR